MSAELMYSSSDETPNFQKQIGCMNGLLRHFLGSSRIATPNHETLLPGSNGKHRAKIKKITSPRRKENNLKNTVKEKQKLSFESPRSSCLSSYSSADCTKTSRVDQHDQSMVSSQPSQRSVNLRNVIKDRINREARGLSVKTATKVDAGQNRTTKHIDSPRPLQSPKPAMTGLDKSSHDVSMLQEVPKTANGRKVGSLDFVPKDARRFSYDERGSNDAVKVKLKDQQRLSLDSRDISMKGSSSVVAKLMGLEISPDPMLIDSNQCFRIKTLQYSKDDTRSLSSRIDENKKTWVSCYPRNLTKEPNSPHSTNANSEKHIATRYPDQPAPWNVQTPPTAPNSSLTVYGRQQSRDKTTEPPSTVMEQPSPVSVLDATFYEDESPSPVKKKSNAEWSPMNDKQLIFDDAVNEILPRKLEKESSYEPWVSTIMVEDKMPKSHEVVRDLCSDIDKLRSASNMSLDEEVERQKSVSLGDLMLGSMDWSKCSSEFPGVVLDVERLIFKDLICEVISSEAANPQG